MLSILSLGLGSGYIRYYAKYKVAKDEISINKLNGLYLQLFSIIGCIAFGCGMFLSNNLRLVFAEGLTEVEYGIAKVLMVLLHLYYTILRLLCQLLKGVISWLLQGSSRQKDGECAFTTR